MTSETGTEISGQPEWNDLASNRPGQSARKKAVELRQAAPMKAVLARILGVHRDERHWRVGADGEEEVAWRLRKLGKGWHVLHSVPVGDRGSDIDHVVIGPGGVFTLNTKNHTGQRVSVTASTVFVNGQNTSLRQRTQGLKPNEPPVFSRLRVMRPWRCIRSSWLWPLS